jgi:probable F420-dependent oxidoreductase
MTNAAERIGRVGVWTFALDMQPSTRVCDLAAELQDLGYGAIWIPETAGRDPLVHAMLLLSSTSSIGVATGIASIWSRDPLAMTLGQKTIAEAHPERFLLGLGVSHAPMVEGLRKSTYGKPLAKMRDYLDEMDRMPFVAAPPPESDGLPRVLAALGPKMLGLAAGKADGAHTYFVPVEHTAAARAEMGPDAVLAVEQAVVLATDPEKARTLARGHMERYLGLPNYTNNLRRLGYGDDDLEGGGGDRLVDAIVAWGDEDAIHDRVEAHFEAGATHVCVQVIEQDLRALPLDAWRTLAGALIHS